MPCGEKRTESGRSAGLAGWFGPPTRVAVEARVMVDWREKGMEEAERVERTDRREKPGEVGVGGKGSGRVSCLGGGLRLSWFEPEVKKMLERLLKDLYDFGEAGGVRRHGVAVRATCSLFGTLERGTAVVGGGR